MHRTRPHIRLLSSSTNMARSFLRRPATATATYFSRGRSQPAQNELARRVSPHRVPDGCHERSLCVKWHPSASVLKNVIAGGHGTGRTDHKLTILTAVFDNCLPSDECSIVGC